MSTPSDGDDAGSVVHPGPEVEEEEEEDDLLRQIEEDLHDLEQMGDLNNDCEHSNDEDVEHSNDEDVDAAATMTYLWKIVMVEILVPGISLTIFRSVFKLIPSIRTSWIKLTRRYQSC